MRKIISISILCTAMIGLLLLAGIAHSQQAPSPKIFKEIPPGYSSEEIHVKFHEGTVVDYPELLLPPDLLESVKRISPLFTLPKDKLKGFKERGEKLSKKKMPDLTLWFTILLKKDVDAVGFIETLRQLDYVEIVEPAPLPAPPPQTPNFMPNQGYLCPATDGIDVGYSWIVNGGNGAGVRIYDVEYSWNQMHEDFTAHRAVGIPVLLDAGDSAVDYFNDTNHGTAVLGILIADNDTKGITGISWGADITLAPVYTTNLKYSPWHAISLAVADGSPGDIILIEQQEPVCGLGFNGPLEFLNAVFDAIQTAVANGFVVVEAAGNGNVNLDQPACGGIFDRNVRDSGAIIVGAGRPPNSGTDRQRESFSSYGSRVDVQGWGSAVMTTGAYNGSFYRDPGDPTNPNFWYTDSFNGTSSASAIIAGAAANLQGITLSQYLPPLTSFQVRNLLTQTGSPQMGNTAEHIGPRPNLFNAICLMGGLCIDVIRFSSASYIVNENAGSVLITVNRTGGSSGGAVGVSYFTSSIGTATAGSDYTSTSGTLSWANGDTTNKTFSVPIINDTLDEPNETFWVTLSSPTGGALVKYPTGATVTIIDDDRPTVQFSTANSSGSEAMTPALFTVTLSQASWQTVTVFYETVDGTAKAPGDYTATSGWLTFNPGVISQTISVPIINDTAVEGDETFTVWLSNATNAILGITTHTYTINDDVGMIQFSSEEYSVNENGGSVLITVVRTGGSEGAVGVTYATSTLTGTATPGSDYTPTSGTLSWANGDTAGKTFSVPIINDSLIEATEDIRLELSNPTGGATLGHKDWALVMIIDDEPPPTVQFSAAISSGSEATTPASITVTLSAASGKNVEVDFATADGTATAGSDYTAVSGMLTFLPGVTSQTITVPIINDTAVEPNETFTVTLSSPVNATLGAITTHTYTIIDDDAGAIQLSSATYSVNENGGSVLITVNRTGGSTGVVKVNYATSNGSATAGSDYTSTSGTLSWASGDTAGKTFSVPITNDTLDEPNETFTVTLTNPTGGATLGSPSSATVTIIDDDPTPTVQFSAASSSGSEATTPASITVTLSAASGRTVRVNYATANGTATAGSDYTARSGTLTFNAGVTSQTISIPIINDTAVEPNETFTVTLSRPVNATLGAITTHTYTINNDDNGGTIQLSSATYSVNENGGSVLITVTRAGGSSGAVGVSYATSNGTATAGSDYSSTSGTLSWANGDSSNKTFSVPILDDSAYEGNETVNLTLSSPTGGATLGSPSTAVLNILDDNRPHLDFDKDGKTDIAVWRPGDGFWYIISSKDGSIVSEQWGSSALNDVLVPGDYDGDGKTDIAIWRPADGYWYIISSKDGSIISEQWGSGALNDVPVPGDYDGDGVTDIAIWRPVDGYWYIISSKDGSVKSRQWGSGALNDVPVPGDYDGDGKTDIAIWRPGDGYWYIISSKDGSIISQQWGSSALNDVLVPGDYDGDGKTDIAIWRPGTGYWYIISSKDGSIISEQWGSGALNDVPVPGDYDGDGKTDIAIWRPGDGYWYIINSKDDSITSTQWGLGSLNDEPISE